MGDFQARKYLDGVTAGTVTANKAVIADANGKVGGVTLSSATTIAAISTADATDLASAVTLANVNKAKINDILVKLKAIGVIASS